MSKRSGRLHPNSRQMIIWPGLAMASLALLSACGFRPLYASDVGGPGKASLIASVSQIRGRSGFTMQDELEKLFRSTKVQTGAPIIEVTYTEVFVPLGFRLDRSATRVDVVMSGTYVLRSAEGKILVQGPFTTRASYEAPGVFVDPNNPTGPSRDGAYADLSNQLDARERAARDAARLIYANAALRLAHARDLAKKAPGQPAIGDKISAQ